ncbi:MAG: hypothetical protein ACOYN3_04340 [Acidimicrobiia bacterium]
MSLDATMDSCTAAVCANPDDLPAGTRVHALNTDDDLRTLGALIHEHGAANIAVVVNGEDVAACARVSVAVTLGVALVVSDSPHRIGEVVRVADALRRGVSESA